MVRSAKSERSVDETGKNATMGIDGLLKGDLKGMISSNLICSLPFYRVFIVLFDFIFSLKVFIPVLLLDVSFWGIVYP